MYSDFLSVYLMSHALKTAAVVPTDSVKLFLVLKKINKKSEIVKKKCFSFLPSWFWHKLCDFWTKYYNLCTKDCILHVSHAKRNLITHSRCVQSGLHAVTWVMVPSATPVRQNLTGKRYKQHALHSWWRYSVILHAILILYFVSTVFVIFLLLIRCRRSFFWATPSVPWWHSLAKYAVTSQSITDWLAVELCSALIHQCYAIPPRIVFRLGKTAKYE